MMKEKSNQTRKNFDKEIIKVLNEINTNDFSIVCPEPENTDAFFYFKCLNPFITFNSISSRDLGEITCPIINGEYKTNMIIEIISKIKDFPNIIVKLDNNLFYLNDAAKILNHYETIPAYEEDYNLFLVEGKNDDERFDKDITQKINNIIDKTIIDNKKLFLIVNDKYADSDILNNIGNAIIIDARGRELKITNINLIKFNMIMESFMRGLEKRLETTIVGTKEDILSWVYKIEGEISNQVIKNNITEKGLNILKDSIANIDDDKYVGGYYIIEKPIGTLEIKIDYDLPISSKYNQAYYTVNFVTESGKNFDYKDVIIKDAEREKNLATPEPVFDKPKKKPEGTKTSNTVFEKKESKTLGTSPLEFIYTSLLDEYIKLTEENPKDYDARKSLIEMIKDTKSIL